MEPLGPVTDGVLAKPEFLFGCSRPSIDGGGKIHSRYICNLLVNRFAEGQCFLRTSPIESEGCFYQPQHAAGRPCRCFFIIFMGC